MDSPLLTTEALRICYGDFVAVESVSMDIGRGSVVSLIGSNGAGKSTLLNAIAGLEKPTSGRVLFDGEDITGMTPDQVMRRGLCLVPEGGRCFSRMRVEENLLMGSYVRSARKKAPSMLRRVYDLFPVLAEKRNQYAGSLSGGQRQMVAIGRALMSSPQMIMFDEISLGLAPVVINDLYTCIRKINREEGVTVLVVEQDTQKALQVSDVCFVLLKGKVSLSRKTETLDAETVKHAYFGI